MLLPWLCDAASKEMDVLFSLRVLARTLVDDGSWGATVFEGGDWGKVPCTRACKILGGVDCHRLIMWVSMTVVEDFIEDQAC